MAIYKYKAKTMDGKSVSDTVESISELEAIDLLLQKGLLVESIKEIRAKNKIKIDIHESLWVSDQVLAMTAGQFAIMLKAGLSMSKVVELIAEQTKDRLMKRILFNCVSDINNGLSLSQSLDKNGKKIPLTFIETVRAGETSGKLEVCFESLRAYYEKEHKVKQKVRSAMTYPIILICIAIVVVSIVMVKLVPTMLSMFDMMHNELPLPTRILLELSNFLKYYGLFVLFGIVLISFILILFGRTQKGARFFGKIKLMIPVINNITVLSSASQFANTMYILLSAGLPVVNVISLIARIIDNKVIGDTISKCIPKLEEGSRLGSSLEDSNKYLPNMLIEMISIGEESGSLEETMSTIGMYYDSEAETASNRALSLLEPIMTVIMGLLVAFIMIAIYIPMFTMETTVM